MKALEQTKPRKPARAAQKKPATRAEQRERTRAAIIESAIRVFADVGYDATKTRTVAARAKANHGLVHYYFSSKLKLWKAAIEHLFERARAEMAVDGNDGSDENDDLSRLRGLIRRYVRFSAKYPEYARILFDEGRKRSPRLDWMIEHYLQRNYENFDDLIRRLQLQGHLPDVSPLVLQYMIFGMAHTLFTLAPEVGRKTGADPLRDDDLIDQQVEAIEALLLGRR